MKIILGIVISREFSSFSFHSDAINVFKSVLSNGLLGFKSDLMETLSRFVNIRATSLRDTDRVVSRVYHSWCHDCSSIMVRS